MPDEDNRFDLMILTKKKRVRPGPADERVVRAGLLFTTDEAAAFPNVRANLDLSPSDVTALIA